MAQDQGLPQVEETVRMLRELRARLPASRSISPADLQATNIATVRVEASRPPTPPPAQTPMLDEELLILSDTSGLDELPDEGTVPGASGPLPEWDAEPTFEEVQVVTSTAAAVPKEAAPAVSAETVEFEVESDDLHLAMERESTGSNTSVDAGKAAEQPVVRVEASTERSTAPALGTAAALVRSPVRPDGNPWLTRERFLLVNWDRQQAVVEEEWDEREATLRERFLAVNWERSPLHERRAAPAPSVPAQPVGTVGGFFSEVDW